MSRVHFQVDHPSDLSFCVLAFAKYVLLTFDGTASKIDAVY